MLTPPTPELLFKAVLCLSASLSLLQSLALTFRAAVLLSLVLELFKRFRVGFLIPAAVHHLRLVLQPHADAINAIRGLALRQWQHDLVPQALITLAHSSIVLSICKLLDGRGETMVGDDSKPKSTEPAVAKASASSERDPWSKPRPQTRWEDLLLSDDRPFINDQQKKLAQVHRLQLSANTGGLALTTKAHLQEMSQIRCKQPAVIPAVRSEQQVPRHCIRRPVRSCAT